MNEYPRLINVSSGQVIEINGEKFSVGRSLKSSFVLNSVYISRTHFILEKNNGTWILRDNSSNGTLHNGQIVNYGRTRNLQHGDSIELINAETEFKFQIYPEEEISITDEQLCEVVESVISPKNEAVKSNLLNDHCYNVVSPLEQPIIVNEVIISTGGELSDCNIPIPGTSSGSDVSSNRKRSSSSEKITQNNKDSEESPPKKNKSNSFRQKSKETQKSSLEEDEKVKKADAISNFDMAEEEMQCSICSEMFIKAVTLNCCHTFCKYCINQWKKQQSICPICRNKITGMAPTLVLDNFIEKLISKMDDETKAHRKEMIEYRIAAEKLQVGSVASTSKNLPQSSSSSSAVTISTTVTSHSTVTISSDDEDAEGYSEDDYSDDEEDFFENYYNYDGLPGKYYGGYGRCYNCNRTGHWANGCPYR